MHEKTPQLPTTPLHSQKADVCLILEGSYPYVTGGISSWTEELIKEQSHLSFHLCVIVTADAALDMKYTLPGNVIGVTVIRLNELAPGAALAKPHAQRLHQSLREPLAAFMRGDDFTLDGLRHIIAVLREAGRPLGSFALFENEAAWEQITALYEADFSGSSFIHFFLSYRALIGGLYSMLLAPLPSAHVYHTLSTGFAGLLAARAKIETGKAVILTEHANDANDCRLAVANAQWLDAPFATSLAIDTPARELRDLWVHGINNLSRITYAASDPVIALYAGHQPTQLSDGANKETMRVIANGVDIRRFQSITRNYQEVPTIAFIGRVVPTKDIKTFIRTVSLLRQTVPDLQAYIIGAADESAAYYEECVTLARLLGLHEAIRFTGHVKIDDYLPIIDIVVLTSLSETQPLSILEAGAVGIPIVATDVGACREIIEGAADENPHLGLGGVVTPLGNPSATAQAILRLLSNHPLYGQSCQTMAERVRSYYNKTMQHQAYRNLYAQHLK